MMVSIKQVSIRRCTKILFAALLAAALTGCAASEREHQLHRVAKDWCETIRASQVIPVYPLTEDLRPGDVFLVQRSIAEQAKEWKERGFLPLDDHRVRLGKSLDEQNTSSTIDFSRMYFAGYWKDTFHAKDGNERPIIANPGRVPEEEQASSRFAYTSANAPRAAFPSYSFEVRTGMGLGAAFPISGVPVGLSFMQTDHANGSVLIADAYTYAADVGQLCKLLAEWVKRSPDVQSHLDQAVQQRGGPVFLRVVSRVYLAGGISVVLTDARSGGAEGRGGSSPGAPIPSGGVSTLESMEQVLTTLDERANTPVVNEAGDVLPGAAVRFTWASSRSVSMSEVFPTPLVIGYLGFDVPVFEGSVLGAPLPTWSVLRGDATPSKVSSDLLTSLDLLVQLAKGDDASRRRAVKIVRVTSLSMVAAGIDPTQFSKHAAEADSLLSIAPHQQVDALPLVRKFQRTEGFLNDQSRPALLEAISFAIASTRP